MVKKFLYNIVEAKDLKRIYGRLVRLVYEEGYDSPSTRYILNVVVHLKDVEKTLKYPDHPEKLPITNPNFIEKYVKSLIYGEQSLVRDFDYTYYKRLREYFGKDQIKYIINELKKLPYSRQAVAVTIDPKKDLTPGVRKNIPCLQEIAFNYTPPRFLHMSVVFRSNDVYKAFYYNAYSLIKLGEYVANKFDWDFKSYTHYIFNAHIYKEDLKEVADKWKLIYPPPKKHNKLK